MSPMFGVGVNYAIQDAVALANAIADDLATGPAPVEKLDGVQQRREEPVREMQRLGHKAIARQTTGSRIAPRWIIGLLRITSPRLRRYTARFIGIGFLPEHVNRRDA